MPALLDEAFSLLGERIVLAHAKDRAVDGTVVPAGTGIVPWPRYLDLLYDVGYTDPLILHGLEEADVGAAMAFLRHLPPDVRRSDQAAV